MNEHHTAHLCIQHHLVPVGTDSRVVGNLVAVHSPLILILEPVLLTVGPDAGCPQEGLLEVRVDGGASDGLQTLQLTRCSHIETLDHLKGKPNLAIILI